MDEFGPVLEPVEGGEITGNLRGSFRPSAAIPVTDSSPPDLTKPEAEFSDLEQAFRLIEANLDKGHPFTNREIDVGARLIMTKISGEEKSWIREIADRIHKRPLWHCFAGRRVYLKFFVVVRNIVFLQKSRIWIMRHSMRL